MADPPYGKMLPALTLDCDRITLTAFIALLVAFDQAEPGSEISAHLQCATAARLGDDPGCEICGRAWWQHTSSQAKACLRVLGLSEPEPLLRPDTSPVPRDILEALLGPDEATVTGSPNPFTFDGARGRDGVVRPVIRSTRGEVLAEGGICAQLSPGYDRERHPLPPPPPVEAPEPVEVKAVTEPQEPQGPDDRRHAPRPRRSWTAEERAEIVAFARASTVYRAAKQYDVSRSVVKRWLVAADRPEGINLADRIREDTKRIEERTESPRPPAKMVPSGVRHTPDYDGARRAAFGYGEDV